MLTVMVFSELAQLATRLVVQTEAQGSGGLLAFTPLAQQLWTVMGRG